MPQPKDPHEHIPNHTPPLGSQSPPPTPPQGTPFGTGMMKTVEEALRRMTWNRTPSEKMTDEARAAIRGSFDGRTADGWSCTVVVYVLDEDVCYDGAAASLQGGLIVHLTPALAEIAVGLAERADRASRML
jgi:hypothetical protein